MSGPRPRTARVYDERQDGEGTRILVDRLWPRGVRKEDPRIDEWLKEVAPSNDLRTWYDHDADKEQEFRRRYRAELKEGAAAEALAELREKATEQVTLLTASKALEISQAAALADLLGGSTGGTKGGSEGAAKGE